MEKIFEAHTGLRANDFSVESEARAAVEAHGSGYVVTFVRTPWGDKSSGMQTFDNGAWRGVDISGGC